MQFILIICAMLLFFSSECGNDYETVADEGACSPVRILADDMGIEIRAVGPSDITEAQLRCNLVKIANERQFDSARDYLTSDYLWVSLFLEDDGKVSSVPAGRLRRLVPVASSDLETDPTRTDHFIITIESAKTSLLRAHTETGSQ